jgi:hypothetical protein
VYHDYTLFSLGEFNGKITSFGMLGFVHAENPVESRYPKSFT